MEEQIAIGESERTAQEEVVSKVQAELNDIQHRSGEIDTKVEQVSARVEELTVSTCIFTELFVPMYSTNQKFLMDLLCTDVIIRVQTMFHFFILKFRAN